jgi:hypothetical protein
MTTPGHLRWPAALALLVAVYLAGVGAVALRPEGDAVAAWWPAAGLAAALVALSPRRWWPGLAAALVVCRIEVESAHLQGTTVTVRLPLARTDVRAAAPGLR